MKQKWIHIFQPILLWCLARVLKQLRPLFQNEDIGLQQCLRNNNFHLALCNHPSILFGEKSIISIESICCLDLQIKFLAKCIRIGLLKTDAGHQLLDSFGIPSYYGNGVEFWFEESHSPIIQYHIPTECADKDEKIVVYTVLTGNYDNVNEILYKEDGVDYLLFTNNPSIKSKTWQVIFVESKLDNLLLSREIKMLPYKFLDKKYDVSIYIDANAVIYGELSQLTSYLQSDIITLSISQHGERSSVKEEVQRIIELFHHIDKDRIFKQYSRYINNGFNDDLGLAECSILVRKHKNAELQNLMTFWWNEFQNGVRRDQISLMPSISELNFSKYILMNGYVRHNQFCKIVSHK